MSWKDAFKPLFKHPWVGFGVSIIALVVSYKMTAAWANALLLLAWVTFVSSAFRIGPLAQQPIKRRLLWTLLIAGVLAALIYSFLWTLPFKAPSEFPYVFATLQIEAPDGGFCPFRVQVTNGNTPVKNVRLNSKSAGFTAIEKRPVIARMMAPAQTLSIPGSPAILYVGRKHELIVQIFYDRAVTGLKNKSFVATHRFTLAPNDLKPQLIHPEGSQYKEGTWSPQEAIDAFQRVFAGETGMTRFGAPETIAGKPNLSSEASPKRSYKFDGGSRTVIFHTETTRNPIEIFMPLKRTWDGEHEVIIYWQADGGSLCVDGDEKHLYWDEKK